MASIVIIQYNPDDDPLKSREWLPALSQEAPPAQAECPEEDTESEEQISRSGLIKLAEYLLRILITVTLSSGMLIFFTSHYEEIRDYRQIFTSAFSIFLVLTAYTVLQWLALRLWKR